MGTDKQIGTLPSCISILSVTVNRERSLSLQILSSPVSLVASVLLCFPILLIFPISDNTVNPSSSPGETEGIFESGEQKDHY